ncbi:thioesterase II family protein [Streptomyces qinglanensis]|uniref:thioesterase II family protein n=1 Tax=Streptomyces qinglanensis TaxID=943816 RepID=UPI0037AC7836
MTVDARYLPYRSSRRSGARATVFCLPHAGGGASAYHRWVGADPLLDVQPVQLPGREDLLGEEPARDAAQLVSLLGPALADLASGPTVLFGHSMGAVLAAELAVWLRRNGAPPPLLLVVSGRRGGARRSSGPAQTTAYSSDEELATVLLRMGGTPREVFDDPQLRSLVLATVRSDLLLLHRYRRSYGDAEVPAPVLACGGREDSVTGRELADWSAHTALGSRVRLFPGGHFYLHRQQRSLFRALHTALGPGGPPTPPEPGKEHHAADRLR